MDEKTESEYLCVASLFAAIQQSHGTVNGCFLKMSLGDFIKEVAGPNNIKFTYEVPNNETRIL